MSDYDLYADELLLRQSIIINTTGKDSQQQKRGTVFDEHVDCNLTLIPRFSVDLL